MHRLKREQFLPISLDQAWDFFATPKNLNDVTPDDHERHFKAVEGGVLMIDQQHYDIGKSVFGWMSGKLFVHKMVQQIFDYRYRKLENYFTESL